MKIFISIPITGREDTLKERYENALEWISEHFEDAETVAQSNLEMLIESKKSVPDDEFPYYMGKDIQAVLEADAILMCDGWEHSIGCLLEHRAAELFRIKIIEENK